MKKGGWVDTHEPHDFIALDTALLGCVRVGHGESWPRRLAWTWMPRRKGAEP